MRGLSFIGRFTEKIENISGRRWSKKLRFYRAPQSISQKILAAIFIVSSIVTLMITTVQLSFDYFQEMSILEKNLQLVEQSYTKSIASSLWQLHDTQIQTQLDGIISIPGIQFVKILDQNKTIAYSGNLSSSKTVVRTFDLLHYDNKGVPTLIGKLEVYASVDEVLNKLYKKVFIIFITQLFKTLLVSFIIYLTIQQMLTRHLVSISQYLKNFHFDRHKQLMLDRVHSVKTKEYEDDELDTLVDSINEMRVNLNRSYEQLHMLNKELEERIESKTQLILEQRQKLEFSSKMSTLGEMAGGIAHEINNPITMIASVNRLIRKMVEKGINDPEKFYKCCSDIDNTVNRITKITTGLRIVSRDASNESFAPCRVEEILDDVLSLSGEKFKINGVDIRIDLKSEGFQTVIDCCRIQLSQVFLNLLGNSYDAIEGFSDRWVDISCFKNNEDQIIIRFMDSGKGIPKELQEKIFLPFFTTKEVGKGTGLGLSLSSSIIKNHNGQFFIDNASKYTCFVINLPIKRT